MEKIGLAVALIQDVVDDRMRLLLKLDSFSRTWRFVTGERIQPESFRETVEREVAWQLDLDRNRDFLVASMAQLTIDCNDTLPDCSQMRALEICFYPVHIYRRHVFEGISRQPQLRWFACHELFNSPLTDGTVIDPKVVTWLKKWEIVQPWN
jgi:hypothetical protein